MPTQPFWMRVKRTGNTWLLTYSQDGVTWLTGVSFSFTMTVADLGPYAGNAGSPPPAWTASVDYFFNTASPIVPEDGGSGVTTAGDERRLQCRDAEYLHVELREPERRRGAVDGRPARGHQRSCRLVSTIPTRAATARRD